MALDVDLDEGETGQLVAIGVERPRCDLVGLMRRRHGLQRRKRRLRHTAVEEWRVQRARAVAARQRHPVDLQVVVRRLQPPQRLEHPRLRLESVDLAARPDQRAQCLGIDAEMRPDVDDDRARPHQAPQAIADARARSSQPSQQAHRLATKLDVALRVGPGDAVEQYPLDPSPQAFEPAHRCPRPPVPPGALATWSPAPAVGRGDGVLR